MICRLEWGVEGARTAADRGDAIIIVDTLSFSTGVIAAVNAGACVYPFADSKGAAAFAELLGAEMAVRRHQVPSKGRFSLSPPTLLEAKPGTKIVLPSPNGARCSLAATGSPVVCAGALVNASAVAEFTQRESSAYKCDISLIACGEALDPYNPDTTTRFALEDLLGAGAIAQCLQCEGSPEMRAAVAAFDAARSRLTDELIGCESGLELIEMGYLQDVEFAAQLDTYHSVGVFDGRRYSRPLKSGI